jgi:hypothetical protein
MVHFNINSGNPERPLEHSAHPEACVYTREAFRAILARQPEWKIRAALEEGNIPSSNIEHAVEWLKEQDQLQQTNCYWM